MEHHPVVTTTQSLARQRPAWSAVWAQEQTAGRGQYDRSFVSDPGGFYLSAVLPFDGDAAKWRGFALAVGWAVRKQLQAAGVEAVRLRWPNDLMIGPRKLGGILTEQGARDTLLVGLGLNVTNHPARHDPALSSVATRLADQAGCQLNTPELLLKPMLRAIREAWDVFGREGLAGLVPELNSGWRERRAVELELMPGLEPARMHGSFMGIDASGHLLIQPGGNFPVAVPPHHVHRLREV